MRLWRYQTDVSQLKAMTTKAAEHAKLLTARLAAAETLGQLHALGLDQFATYVEQPTELICQLYDQLAEAALVQAQSASSLRPGQCATGRVPVRRPILIIGDAGRAAAGWAVVVGVDVHEIAADCARRHLVDVVKLRTHLVNVRE